MLLKNLQLFETILSKKRASNYWYRSVFDDQNGLTPNPYTRYGDRTPAMWFQQDPLVAISFGGSYPKVYKIKVKENIDLWNVFDNGDWNRYIDYLEENDLTNEKIQSGYINKRDTFISIEENTREWYKKSWKYIEQIARFIKDMGYRGLLLQEDDSFTIELFYSEDISDYKIISYKEQQVDSLYSLGVLPVGFKLLPIGNIEPIINKEQAMSLIEKIVKDNEETQETINYSRFILDEQYGRWFRLKIDRLIYLQSCLDYNSLVFKRILNVFRLSGMKIGEDE